MYVHVYVYNDDGPYLVKQEKVAILQHRWCSLRPISRTAVGTTVSGPLIDCNLRVRRYAAIYPKTVNNRALYPRLACLLARVSYGGRQPRV